MRKLILATALVAACSPILQSTAQCPTASFSLNDTICSTTPVVLTNTSSGGTGPLTYAWDFCPGDLGQNPIVENIGDFGGFSQYMNGMALVYENGNWFGFTPTVGSQSLIRYDFGSSLDSTPVPNDLGNFGGFLSYGTDIQIMKEGTQWYGLVCTFFGLFSRIEFGDSINNPLPVCVPINNVSGYLTNPMGMKLVYDGQNYHALIANISSFQVTVVSFGNTLTNNAPATANISTLIPDLQSVTLARDCDQWYGFTASTTSGLWRIDFGTSITSTPSAVGAVTTQGAVEPSLDIDLANENGKWYGFALGTSINRIDFGSSLANTSPVVSYTGIPLITGEKHFVLQEVNSKWYAIVQGNNSTPDPDLRRFIFPDPCFASITGSTAASPPGVLFSQPGYQYVALQVTDSLGNFNCYADSVLLLSSPIALFSSSSACLGLPVNFTDSSTITGDTINSWDWDFGDSTGAAFQHPSHIYSSAGDYIVTLVVTANSGCATAYTDTISVRALPVADMSFTDSSCAEAPVLFTDASTSSQDPITTWNWDFGDSTTSAIANPQHIFAVGGEYLLVLTVTTDKGCWSFDADTIHIKPRPVPDFIVANTCIGETVDFVNLSTISDSSALNYTWDFDDATTSSQPNPSHAYAAVVDVYDVTLIAISPNGCADTMTSPVRIGNQPVPSFIISPSTVCKGNGVNFIDQSSVPGSDPGDTINTWYWDFGDSFSSSLQNPSHTYADTGTYVVSLVVTSPTACDSLVTQVVTVIDAPVAAFNYSDVCFGLSNSFTDFSTAPAGSVLVDWSWDFGDSTTATGTSVSHNYSVAGTYSVILTVTDTFGCTDFVMHQVSANPVPVASFTNSTACTGSAVTFTNTSTIGNGDSIVSYFWDFGDAGTSLLKNPVHTYTAFGQKQVMMVATSLHGCIDTTYKLIFVFESPTPAFSYSQTCKGQATQFTYIPNPFPSTITTYSWSFGDLGTSILDNPVHMYANATTYQATVTVTDNNGCIASITQPVIVYPIPDAYFGYVNSCVGTPTSFYDSSSIASGSISSYLWNFGNGNTSGAASPSFVFDSAGTYSVSLNIVSDGGCADSVSRLVTVVPPPVSGFLLSASSGAPPFNVNFTSTSTGISSWLWDFGDGTTASSPNASHTYADTGNFTVSLIVYNASGCSDTTYQQVVSIFPYLDLAVLNVSTGVQNNIVTLTADLFNLSNLDIHNFEIIARLEGGTILHEYFNGTLPPGPLTYTFHSKLETNQYTNPAYICVEVKNPNNMEDAVASNNTKCTGTGTSFEIINIYYNPGTTQAIVHFTVPEADLVTLDIYDDAGRKTAATVTIKAVTGLNTYYIEARRLAHGAFSCSMRYRDISKMKWLLKF